MKNINQKERDAIFWRALKATIHWKAIGTYILIGVFVYVLLMSWALHHAPPHQRDLESLPPVEGIFKYHIALGLTCNRCGVSTLNGEKIYCAGYGFFGDPAPCALDPSFNKKLVRVHRVLNPSFQGLQATVIKIENLTDATVFGINNNITYMQWILATKNIAIILTCLLSLLAFLGMASLTYFKLTKSEK